MMWTIPRQIETAQRDGALSDALSYIFPSRLLCLKPSLKDPVEATLRKEHGERS